MTFKYDIRQEEGIMADPCIGEKQKLRLLAFHAKLRTQGGTGALSPAKPFLVYHLGNGGAYCEIVSRHNSQEEARAECKRLNEEEREANGGRLDGGHWYQSD